MGDIMMWIRNRIFLLSAILAGCSAAYGQETLRAYADKIGLNIGSCIFAGAYRNQQYSEVLTREFNTIVAENEMKAASMQPQKGQFSFGTADQMVAFAQENNMKVRGHTLVWHAQNPSWLSGGTWTRETLLAEMKAHITGVVGHFKGKVFEWDVVNEAFSDGGSPTLRNSFWKKTIGDDFMDSAFTYAHQADPDAILYYNDYNTSNVTGKSTAVYNKLKQMIDNGVPVSGVGFQSHQTLEEYSSGFIASLKENFDRFAKLGLSIAVTEMDIRITLPTDQSELDKQGEYYREYLETFLGNPACKTFMTWGFTDRYSWIPGTFSGTGDALIFTSDYQPKPAYTAMLDVLKNFIPDAILPSGKSRSDAAMNVYRFNGRTSRDIFNLRGVKVGSYTLLPGSCPVANQTVIIKGGRRPMVFMK
jgi:endo-1,4-beta-xylanase